MNSRELFERREELKHVISELRDELKDVEQQLHDTFFTQARDALRADGKDFGTTYIVAGNRKLKATVRKKVVWDQNELGCVYLLLTSANTQRHHPLFATFLSHVGQLKSVALQLRSQSDEYLRKTQS
jgi:hypothetical protein